MFRNFQVFLRKVSTLKTLQMHSNGNSRRGRLLEIGRATWRLNLEAWRSFVFYMPTSLEWHLYWVLNYVLHLSLYFFHMCIMLHHVGVRRKFLKLFLNQVLINLLKVKENIFLRKNFNKRFCVRGDWLNIDLSKVCDTIFGKEVFFLTLIF